MNAVQFGSILSDRLSSISENAVLVTSKFFTIFFSVITIVIISFYLLIDYDKIKTWVSSLFPQSMRRSVGLIFIETEEKMGGGCGGRSFFHSRLDSWRDWHIQLWGFVMRCLWL